jgi:cell division protein ZapA
LHSLRFLISNHPAQLLSECVILALESTLAMSSMRMPVKTEIFGQMYTIRGELDEDYVLKLANFVDEKMRAVAGATSTVDTQKVAVLAALAIADELHSAQRDIGYREDVLKEQAERCLTLVERALRQSA